MWRGCGVDKVNKDVLYSALPFTTCRGGQITVRKKLTICEMYSQIAEFIVRLVLINSYCTVKIDKFLLQA